MYLIPIIIDSELPFAAAGTDSVLTLPLGTGTVLDHLAARLARLGHGRIAVVSSVLGQDGHLDRARPHTRSQVQVVHLADLPGLAGGCEASDHLLLVEPRHWPAGGYDLESIVEGTRDYRGATHVVAVGSNAADPRERVECDAAGRIRRVQRLYDPVSWPNSTSEAVFCSIVPARAVCDVEFRGLGELRARLAENGIFTQDLPAASGLLDLARPADIIALNRQVISRAAVRPDDEGFHMRSAGVLAGRDCAIDPSCRIIAPVILHHHVRVEQGATLVGPVVIGARAVVAAGAVVAQSVVGAGVTVEAGRRVCQRVLVPAAAAEVDPSDMPATASGCTIAVQEDGAAGGSDATARGRRTRLAIKRAMDIVLAAAALMILSPLLATVAVLIKATSRGPVFFIHRRECRGGREFGCVKFRTMVSGAHARQRELYRQNELDGPQFKMDRDPRVTRVGRWLRRTNIDELPQLFNVLAGQMSLVGPRPSPFRENQICVPWRLARLSVRPGITGVWQICRDRRSEGDFHQWIYYDLAYVKHFSLWLDVKILWYTLTSRGGRNRVPVECLVPAMAETKPLRDEGPCSC